MVDVELALVLGPFPPKSTNVQGAEAQDEGGVKVAVGGGNELIRLDADIIHSPN
jgi:hypothetical protein